MHNRYLRLVPASEHHALTAAPGAVPAPGVSALFQPVMPMTLRDSAIFLMQLAAEVEHALLVQYLYAAFSLNRTAPGVPSTAFNMIFSTAREEMGHLMTVQNVLLALGSSASLYRENMPVSTDFYPFPFTLEPVSRASLAKYVLAEMPDGGLTEPKLSQVRADAGVSGTFAVNQVAHLYSSIIAFLQAADDGIFDPSLATLQGDPVDWRAGTPTITRDPSHKPVDVGPGVFVVKIQTRAQAIDALQVIALQGEGTTGAPGPSSHFKRFLAVYDAAVAAPGPIALPVPTNPDTGSTPGSGAITNPASLLWAQLMNSRYRMLLAAIGHHLTIDQGTSGRSELAEFAFEEMSNVLILSTHLTTLDRTTSAADGKAGPPFEMPYTLLLPVRPVSRWRMQQDLIEDSQLVKDRIRAAQADPDAVLDQLSDDVSRRSQIDGFIAS